MFSDMIFEFPETFCFKCTEITVVCLLLDNLTTEVLKNNGGIKGGNWFHSMQNELSTVSHGNNIQTGSNTMEVMNRTGKSKDLSCQIISLFLIAHFHLFLHFVAHPIKMVTLI
jgi:hypothetical protein